MSETHTEGNYIPKAIRDVVANSERLFQEELARRNAPSAGEPPPTQAPPPPDTQAPAPPPTQSPAPPPTQAPVPATTEDWQQKFNSLRGKYDKEVPQLNARARAAEQENARLNSAVLSLQNEMAQLSMRTTPASAMTPANTKPKLTEEDEQYGEELVVAARRWARDELNPVVAELQAKLDRLESQTTQVSTQSLKGNADNYLDSSTPNWRRLNTDAGFIAWVNEFDPFTGQKRLDLMREAYTKGDGPRASAFFSAYEREHTAIEGSPTADTQTPTGADAQPLETFAAPGRGRPMGAGAPAQKHIWTSADISAFYQDVARGQFRGTEQERLATERDLHAAVAEGRYRE